MVQIASVLVVVAGGVACASAFTGPVGVTTSTFGGIGVADSKTSSAPARSSVVTPRMGGKENAIRCAILVSTCGSAWPLEVIRVIKRFQGE